MRKVSILRKDCSTELTIDGSRLSRGCMGYTLSQEGGNPPVLTLILACSEVVFEGDDVAICAQNVHVTNCGRDAKGVLRCLRKRK